METLIQITGVQYACPQADLPTVMAGLERQKPEVLLVTEQTHDYGIIVRALVGTDYRGVVSRFDLPAVLRTMHRDGTEVLVGKLARTDPEGRCYSVSIDGDTPPDDGTGETCQNLWANWQWTESPPLDCNPDEQRLDISLKVALSELKRGNASDRQTLRRHLDIVLQLLKWDVCRETQQQLDKIRCLVHRHDDPDIRALAPRLRHAICAMGSSQRTRGFQDTFFPQLCQSEAAERMYRQWLAIHHNELNDLKLWQPTIERQLGRIEACLMQLPADLCYQKDTFGQLMHRLLYLNIPRRKLLMLLSALVLRQRLRSLLGLDEERSTDYSDPRERELMLRLTPIFYGNTDNVRWFLQLARERTSADITRLVSLWVMEKRICPDHCHRPLWTALHEAGIYKPTETNWNMQLGVRKSWR